MAKVYLIKPLEKKSIVWHIEAFRSNDDGSISWFNIDETYRWGQGFVEEDMDCNLPFEGDNTAHARTDCGWGAELDDSCACFFEFSDDITEEEQEQIKEAYYEGGGGWLFDGEHNWEIEDDYLEIIGPFTVSLCEEDGTVIEENVKLRNREELKAKFPSSGAWPFDTAVNDSEGGETE